jgi:hypothetical protein
MQELKQWFNIQQFIDLSYIHMLTIKRIKNAPVSQLPSTHKKKQIDRACSNLLGYLQATE